MSAHDSFEIAHRQIKRGDLIGIRSGLDSRLDPNLTNRFGWSLLMLTALHGRADLAELLLSRGADPKRTNQFGDSAASLALAKGFDRLASVLRDSAGSIRSEA